MYFFGKLHFGLRGCCPPNFYTCYRLTKVSLRLDLQRRAASSWALSHISSYYLFIYLFNTVVTTVYAAMKLVALCLVAMLAMIEIHVDGQPAVNS